MGKWIHNLSVKFFDYYKICTTIKLGAQMSNLLHLHRFDIDPIPQGSYVIAFNHGFRFRGAYADPFIICGFSPARVRMIYYEGLSQDQKDYLQRWGMYPRTQIRKLSREIKENESIGVAPEGPAHLMQENGYQGFKGAAWIARKTQKPLLPIKITSKHGWRKGHTEVRIKPIITVPPTATKQDLEEITQQLMKEIT